MASYSLSDVKTLNRGVVIIAGSFAPNGSSAVSASSRKGRGWSVARTSAGLFTITLNKKFNDCLSAVATLQLASAADTYCQVGTIDMSARTVQIRVWDVSGAAVDDVAANANNRINFVFVLSNTTLDPAYG